MSYLLSFCNLGRTASRYSLGVMTDDLGSFAFVNLDEVIDPAKDTGITGLALGEDGTVLLAMQSEKHARIVELDHDLRPQRVRPLSVVTNAHGLIWRDGFAYVVCSAQNAVYRCRLDEAGPEEEIGRLAPSGSDLVHANCICALQDDLAVSSFGPKLESGLREGSVRGLHSGDLLIGALIEPHSPAQVDEDLHVLSSASGAHVVLKADGQIISKTYGGYLRGLSVGRDQVLIGRSAWRRAHRGLGGLRKPPPSDDPHGNSWQRSAVLSIDRKVGMVSMTPTHMYASEIFDVLALPAEVRPARVFGDAAARRLDVLQEIQATQAKQIRRLGNMAREARSRP